MATQFITTLIANRFLLAIIHNCQNNMMVTAMPATLKSSNDS
jgi:hypothetical protein